MENTPTIQMDKDKAKEIYKDYLDVVKIRKEKHLDDLKKVYHALSKGHRILDIYNVFNTTSVGSNSEPKLAIAQVKCREVYFRKQRLGSGEFRMGRWETGRKDVVLPSNTFPEWPTDLKEWQDSQKQNHAHQEITRQIIKTKVPIVPGHLMPNSKNLDDYYVLFEVKEWEEEDKERPISAGDPFLLKRINANAFVILAEWDLTEVEQAVIRGL